jgi:hypothetical protein
VLTAWQQQRKRTPGLGTGELAERPHQRQHNLCCWPQQQQCTHLYPSRWRPAHGAGLRRLNHSHARPIRDMYPYKVYSACCCCCCCAV